MKQTLNRVTVGEDDVDHEVTIQMMDPPGPYPTLAPRLVIVLTMPGLTPGVENRISGWFQCDSLTPEPEYVDRRVQTLMTTLREQRLRLVKNIERAAVGGN